MITVLPHTVFPVRNFSPATLNKGTATRGTATAATVTGSLSAASPNDIARLEEGKRTRQCFKLITDQSLQVALPGGIMPDWIQVAADWYEISAVLRWQNGVISHFEFLITKIENPDSYL